MSDDARRRADRVAGSVAIERRPSPELGADDVLVEVSHCGVCGSDIHMMLEGWGRPGSVGGHEWTGVVAAVGTRSASWRVGDAVVGGPTRALRHVRRAAPADRRSARTATRREPSEEHGAFARYIRRINASCSPCPTGLGLREAALTEPLAVALHGITLSGSQPRRVGDGHRRRPHRRAGRSPRWSPAAWTDVAVVEPAPTRQDARPRARRRPGAAPDELEVPSIAEPDRIVDGAVDVVFECSGHAAAMEAGLAQLRRAGRLVMVGAGIEPPRFDPNRILLNELTITGSFIYDADGFDQALELLGSGRCPSICCWSRATCR